MRKFSILLALVSLVSCSGSKAKTEAPQPASDDPFVWLEEVEGEKALAWVKEQNAESHKQFEKDARFRLIESPIRKIMLAKDRIPTPVYRAGHVYNFWQDEKNVRGLWRRTSVEQYRKKFPKWDVILDLDKLAKAENENWVWKGADCLEPKRERCILALSRGGKDAVVAREFDVATKSFVENGFELPEAKMRFSWVNENALLVGTDFGAGSLTLSGYPRILKYWTRGQKIDDAKTVFETEKEDMIVTPWTAFRPEGNVTFVVRRPKFFEEEVHVFDPETLDLKRLDLPKDSKVEEAFDGRAIVFLRSDWTVRGNRFAAGSLVAVPLADAGQTPELIYAPTPRQAIQRVAATRSHLYVDLLDNVSSRILRFERRPEGWKPSQVKIPDLMNASTMTGGAHDDFAMVQTESFIVPTTISELSGLKVKGKLKQLPARFEGEQFVAKQFEATSKDGTKVPYFVIHDKGIRFDGSNPTILYGYGGFKISITPNYLSVTGKSWLERGGVYAVANIRGGGEFGPAWHQAALKEKRQKAFDDFVAVAEDMIKRKITSPKRLGAKGGSNGGLLMGAMMTQRPDLFNAIVCAVPLLDMIRYTKLLAGHSWIAEYGDPDIAAEREYILKYSPYQNVRADKKYPEVFFVTSTKDDRVHPGHARKMVAKMESMGHKVHYFENIEGGHGAAANINQKIRMNALEYTYFSQRLGL